MSFDCIEAMVLWHQGKMLNRDKRGSWQKETVKGSGICPNASCSSWKIEPIILYTVFSGQFLFMVP